MEEFHVAPEEEILPAPEMPDETSPDRLGTILLRLRNRHEIAGDPPEVPPPIQIEQVAHERAKPVMEKPVPMPEMVTIEHIPTPEAESGLHEASRRLQEVYEAAEHDQPIEAENERRHEVKKEPDAHTSALESAVSQVLTELHDKTVAAHKAFNQLAGKVSTVKLPMPKTLTSLPPLYQKAVWLGFSMAVVILIGVGLFG